MKTERLSALALVVVSALGWSVGRPVAAAERALEPEAQREAAPSAAETEPREWIFEVDPEASSIRFELGATLHTVEGTAEVSGGEVRFDPERGTATGRIEVAARSLETGNENRDEDMHRKVLESADYPEIYFEAERMSGEFSPTGSSRVTIEGMFGIHGDAHSMSLTFDVDAAAEAVEASTEFRVPYVEWGMEDPSKFLLRVDKHVTVTIDAVGSLSPIEPPAAGSGDDQTGVEGGAGTETDGEN